MLEQLKNLLSRLIGLHRQLLDLLRLEKEALVLSDKPAIEEAALAKDACLQAIGQTERDRVRLIGELALSWKRPVTQLTLTTIIQELEQSIDSQKKAMSHALRSQLNALVVLIERVQEQNTYNGALIEKALQHVDSMKSNVFRNDAPQSQTYTQSGGRAQAPTQSRILSKEA